jgi:hypothetical protein
MPPRTEVPEGSDEAGASMLEIVPESRSRVYDVRKVVAAICDKGSVLPLKDRFAKTAYTALARIDGRTVGILASNPMFKAGALDPDSCDKAVSFLILCDSFNIPIVLLVDTPGFLIGVEGEGWSQVSGELAFERSGPERYLSSTQLMMEMLDVAQADDARQAVALGRIAASYATLRQMSLGVSGMLARGEVDAAVRSGTVQWMMRSFGQSRSIRSMAAQYAAKSAATSVERVMSA